MRLLYMQHAAVPLSAGTVPAGVHPNGMNLAQVSLPSFPLSTLPQNEIQNGTLTVNRAEHTHHLTGSDQDLLLEAPSLVLIRAYAVIASRRERPQ